MIFFHSLIGILQNTLSEKRARAIVYKYIYSYNDYGLFNSMLTQMGLPQSDFFEDQENMNEDDDIITLYNEERDVDEDFYHLATLDVDDKWYVVMKPVEKLPDIEEDEVLIYEIREDEAGNDVFVAIESEEELQKVFDEFVKEMEKYDLDGEEGEEA